MEPANDQIQSDLENFREQWRAEVSARAQNSAVASSSGASGPGPATTTSPTPSMFPRGNSSRPPQRADAIHRKTTSTSRGATLGGLPLEDEDGDFVQARAFDEPTASAAATASSQAEVEKEPQTALEFYERAVERETTGKLGDSLHLYRKAYRMDSAVDQVYKKKHFEALWAKKPKPPQQGQGTSKAAASAPEEGPALAAATATAAAAASTQAAPPQPLSLPDLIASFSSLSIEGKPPEVEGMNPPPCPIANLPDEILCHILRDVAILDIGDFTRLSRVCRRLAYLVATEEQIWRRVCLGPESGFGGMHYDFALGVTWEPLPRSISTFDQVTQEEQNDEREAPNMPKSLSLLNQATTRLLHAHYAFSFRTMFRHRPRLRFNGCYISTVNYVRQGQASGHTITWNSPVHIVTYYRYLRFFRDGSCISLLTTDEPGHVVHHLTRRNLALHAGGAHPGLPSAVMKAALRGRWCLSSYLSQSTAISHDDAEIHPPPPTIATTNTEGNNSPPPPSSSAPEPSSPSSSFSALPMPPTPSDIAEAEGDVHIETEGVVGPKYMYRMELSLGNSGMVTTGRRGAKLARPVVATKRPRSNNKMLWKEFWSYNKLTDDWAEFGLRHYQPFFFSRVRSYGSGE